MSDAEMAVDPMAQLAPRRIWSAFGVELEYMVVDRDTLNVRPIADRVFRRVLGGELANEIVQGPITWSNELTAHVMELKTSEPGPDVFGNLPAMTSAVTAMNAELDHDNAMLLPTGMHPWMNPLTETRLWPGENNEIYQAFDRIFNCAGHGWSNLQSMHLNLPFADDAEFGRLHAAVRVLLPIMPALTASSPYVEGRRAPARDFRLETYRKNCRRIKQCTGRVIPERVFTIEHYQQKILGRLYDALRPHDPAGVLLHEWANARGAIARFERNTIEIRVLDTQECPLMDLAMGQLIVTTLQRLAEDGERAVRRLKGWRTGELARIFRRCARDADQAVLNDADYLKTLGRAGAEAEARWVWRDLLELAAPTLPAEASAALDVYLQHGALASRLVRAVGPRPTIKRLRQVFGQLAECLRDNRPFIPA